MTTIANTEGARFWSEIAPTWLELEAQLTEMSILPGALAMERLDARPGDRVLDIGAGAAARPSTAPPRSLPTDERWVLISRLNYRPARTTTARSVSSTTWTSWPPTPRSAGDS